MANAPTEAQEQRTVVEYCGVRHIPVFHIPNGGSRNKAEAANLKRQGVKPGVPDLFVPVHRGKYHGLFIEMKRSVGGTLTKEQREWLTMLEGNGYCAKCCHGADKAIALIDAYMRLGT